MRSQCIVACFWNNKYWAVGDIYDGNAETPRSKEHPKTKRVRQYFTPLEMTQVIAVSENQSPPVISFKPAGETDATISEWELNQMPKIELQKMLESRFGITLPEAALKKSFVGMILEMQKKRKKSNQEIANTVKG